MLCQLPEQSRIRTVFVERRQLCPARERDQPLGSDIRTWVVLLSRMVGWRASVRLQALAGTRYPNVARSGANLCKEARNAEPRYTHCRRQLARVAIDSAENRAGKIGHPRASRGLLTPIRILPSQAHPPKIWPAADGAWQIRLPLPYRLALVLPRQSAGRLLPNAGSALPAGHCPHLALARQAVPRTPSVDRQDPHAPPQPLRQHCRHTGPRAEAWLRNRRADLGPRAQPPGPSLRHGRGARAPAIHGTGASR